MAIRLAPGQLPSELRARAKKMPGVIGKGLHHGALHGQTHLVRKSPKDRGLFKASWKVRRGKSEITLSNSAPYAGIIEFGARPHPVSREGVESIYRWVLRTITAERTEARGIAHAIAEKIRKKGQKPTYLVRDSLDDLLDFARGAVEQTLSEQSHKPARGR